MRVVTTFPHAKVSLGPRRTSHTRGRHGREARECGTQPACCGRPGTPYGASLLSLHNSVSDGQLGVAVISEVEPDV